MHDNAFRSRLYRVRVIAHADEPDAITFLVTHADTAISVLTLSAACACSSGSRIHSSC
jgi:hypothetical protein